MKLSTLMQDYAFIPPEWDREFNHLHTDSRDVTSGDLFIARSGLTEDGRQHITAAVAAGAIAVLAEGEAGFECVFGNGNVSVPVFSIPDLKKHLNGIFNRRYPYAEMMNLIAVTGTNGKSSVTQYIAQLATAVGQQSGVLGTLGNGVWPQLHDTRNTTPDLSVVLRILEEIKQAGANITALEVSSHGLHQGRVSGLSFKTAVLTNISQDHLDYHGDMNEYFAAKRALFVDYPLQNALINIDDEYGYALAQDEALKTTVSGTLLTYGKHADADIRYQNVHYENGLLSADISTPWGNDRLSLPLIGEFNLANALAAIAALVLEGISFSSLLTAVRQLYPVAGRMELYLRPVTANDGKQLGTQQAVIDFAHTPDALENVLSALSGKDISLVFGCGGDRDRAKRPLMALAAHQYAKTVFLTDDNPRFEDNEQIFNDVLNIDGSDRFICQHDRRAAIRQAIEEAQAADNPVVLIAGKGHERYQEIAGIKHPYSDEDVLLELGFCKAGARPSVGTGRGGDVA